MRRPLSCPLSPGIAFGGRKVGAVPKVVPAPWVQPAPNGWPVGREGAKARFPCFSSLLKGGPSSRAPWETESWAEAFGVAALAHQFLPLPNAMLLPSLLLFLQVLTNKPLHADLTVSGPFQGI